MSAALGEPVGQLGRCTRKVLPGLPDGVHTTVSRTPIPLMPCESPGHCSASPSLSPSHAAHSQRKKWAVSHRAIEAKSSHTFSLSSLGEIEGDKGSLDTGLYWLTL